MQLLVFLSTYGLVISCRFPYRVSLLLHVCAVFATAFFTAEFRLLIRYVAPSGLFSLILPGQNMLPK